MRTLRRTLFVLLALALSLTMAATALGKAPARPADPVGGYTCAELGFDDAWAAHDLTSTNTGFSFTLRGASDDICVDVMTSAPGVWHITGTASGVSTLSLIPRDSASPGDSCGGLGLKRPSVLDLYLPKPIPAAMVNACGTQFGEWIDTNGDGKGDTLEMAKTDQAHPLAFMAFMIGRTGAEAMITIESQAAITIWSPPAP